MPESPTIHIRIDEETKKKLKERAKKMSKSVGILITLSDYVRLVLKKKVEEPVEETNTNSLSSVHDIPGD